MVCTYCSTTPPFGNVTSALTSGGESKDPPRTHKTQHADANLVSMGDKEIDKPLVTICNQLEIPERVRNYLKDAGLVSLVRLALIAQNAKDVNELVWKPFTTSKFAGTGDDAPTTAQQAAVLELWWWVKRRVDAGEVDLTGAPTSKDDLDQSITNALDKQWYKRHGFMLSCRRILSSSDLKKLYSMVCTNPITLWIPQPMEIKLASSISKVDIMSMNITDGQTPKAKKQQLDFISSYYAFYERIAALFFSIAYVCIDQIKDEKDNKTCFFSLQVAYDFLDELWDVMHRRYDNTHRPSVDFFCKAFLRMMQFFQTRIRIHRFTLQECTNDITAWNTYWTLTGNHQGPRVRDDGGNEEQKDLLREYTQLNSVLKSTLGNAKQLFQSAGKGIGKFGKVKGKVKCKGRKGKGKGKGKG